VAQWQLWTRSGYLKRRGLFGAAAIAAGWYRAPDLAGMGFAGIGSPAMGVQPNTIEQEVGYPDSTGNPLIVGRVDVPAHKQAE